MNHTSETSAIETITPELADRILEKNTNRRMSEARVLEYGSAMERGEWRVSNDAIVIDKDGFLINGQHRVRAVSVSGVAIQALVVRNADKASQVVMDLGRKRTYADHRQVATGTRVGLEFSSVMRVLLTLKYPWREGQRLTIGEIANANYKKPPSFQQIDAEAEAFPDLDDAISFGRKLSHSTKDYARVLNLTLTASVVGVLLTRRAAHGTQINASEFEIGLHSGVGLYEGDPRLRLRSLSKDRRSHFHVGNVREAAMYVKAFNAWAQKKKMGSSYARDEEQFPMPLGKDPFRPS
jgi:hypothetical protein